MGSTQLGFSDDEQTTAKKQTQLETFLAEMEATPELEWLPLVVGTRPRQR